MKGSSRPMAMEGTSNSTPCMLMPVRSRKRCVEDDYGRAGLPIEGRAALNAARTTMQGSLAQRPVIIDHRPTSTCPRPRPSPPCRGTRGCGTQSDLCSARMARTCKSRPTSPSTSRPPRKSPPGNRPARMPATGESQEAAQRQRQPYALLQMLGKPGDIGSVGPGAQNLRSTMK